MIPEQVWDADPIPERRLYPGRPSGSAMPLAWAHAEYVKLLVSRQTASLPAGANLVVALNVPAVLHWGQNGWQSVQDVPTADTGLGFHAAALDTEALPPGTRVDITWRRQDTGEWRGRDEAVEVTASSGADECGAGPRTARDALAALFRFVSLSWWR